ncbi:MAG: hypothetical protein B7Y97_00795 [Sphingomonas sp. 32-66-10]|nr:MAG: hypothetical protein B7Y97_00795 [Sphingomonas sp. 32-66-10]
MTDIIRTFRPERMPKTITTPAGVTYYRTRYIGETTEGARQHGIEPGWTTYEYWIRPGDDSRRLYAINPTQFWLE